MKRKTKRKPAGAGKTVEEQVCVLMLQATGDSSRSALRIAGVIEPTFALYPLMISFTAKTFLLSSPTILLVRKYRFNSYSS
jgi:hypothetical protein